MAIIYGLYSTREKIVRYIGKTKGSSAERRYFQHYWNDSSTQKVYDWIRQERWLGYDIEYTNLDWCNDDEAGKCEANLIGSTSGLVNQKLNHCQSGKIIRVNMTFPFIENWNGWIGIRYWPGKYAWQAKLQAGGRYHVLPGDGGTIEQRNDTYRSRFGHERPIGDWYFSDPNGAIVARDKYRLRFSASTRWPDDCWKRALGWEDYLH